MLFLWINTIKGSFFCLFIFYISERDVEKQDKGWEVGCHISGAPSVSAVGVFSVAPSCQP